MMLSLLVILLELHSSSCLDLANQIRSQALFLKHLMGCGCFYMFCATMMSWESFYCNVFLFLDGFLYLLVGSIFKGCIQKRKKTLKDILSHVFGNSPVKHIGQVSQKLQELTGPMCPGCVDLDGWLFREILRPANVDGSGTISRDDFMWCMNYYVCCGDDAFMLQEEEELLKFNKRARPAENEAQPNPRLPLLTI